MSDKSVYRTPPLSSVDGIPMFCREDRYVENYKQIAHDHLSTTDDGGGNPNIEEGLWLQLEESTRKLISRYSKAGARVLDAGVGMGRVLAPLNDLARFGVDISLDYLRVARKNGFEVAFARLEDLPYSSEQFDLVVACDVLEHVIDLNLCCGELVRVLRKGGNLVVRVPYLDDLDAYLNENLSYEFIHLRSFDLPGLRLLFEKIFDLEFLEYSFVSPYLKGHPRMKLKLLKEADSARILAQSNGHPALELLKRATEVTAEDYMNWLYELRDSSPELFAEVAEQLVEPLEINVVFSKK